MMRTAADIDGRRTASSHRGGKVARRPRSQYSESTTGNRAEANTSTSSSKLDTSFESYFGVERSASSDVVRIRVPYGPNSKEIAGDVIDLRKKSQNNQNTNTTKERSVKSMDSNRIRIEVSHQENGAASAASVRSLESSVASDLSLNNSNTKSNNAKSKSTSPNRTSTSYSVTDHNVDL